jgi:hypothetical protein
LCGKRLEMKSMINNNQQLENPNHKMYLVEYYDYRDFQINGYRMINSLIITAHDVGQVKSIFSEEHNHDDMVILRIHEMILLEDYGIRTRRKELDN